MSSIFEVEYILDNFCVYYTFTGICLAFFLACICIYKIRDKRSKYIFLVAINRFIVRGLKFKMKWNNKSKYILLKKLNFLYILKIFLLNFFFQLESTQDFEGLHHSQCMVCRGYNNVKILL